MHARSMQEPVRSRTLFKQELTRLSDRMESAMRSYRAAMADYVAATNVLLGEDKSAPAPPSRHSTPASAPRFRAETRS